jgi:hypothetical protein
MDHPVFTAPAFVGFANNGAPLTDRGGSLLFESQGKAEAEARRFIGGAPAGTRVAIFSLVALSGYEAGGDASHPKKLDPLPGPALCARGDVKIEVHDPPGGAIEITRTEAHGDAEDAEEGKEAETPTDEGSSGGGGQEPDADASAGSDAGAHEGTDAPRE